MTSINQFSQVLIMSDVDYKKLYARRISDLFIKINKRNYVTKKT